MQEKQAGKSQDDLDMEIVDLDDQPISRERKASPLFHNSHFLLKQRRVQALITSSIVLLLLLSIFGSNTAVRNKFLSMTTLLTPTLTQAIPAGTDRFYVDGEPIWGHLFVDGKLIAHPPSAYTGDTPLRLQRGVHTLRWLAAPFLPQSCIVSVPINFQTDTCGYKQMFSNNQGGGWLFKFPISLTKLPSVQQEALIAAVQKALGTYTSTEIVQPGEVYAIDALGLQQSIAREPLKVTVRYSLDTDASLNIFCGPIFFVDGTHSCSSQGRDCRTFCNASQYFEPKQTEKQVWNIFAAVRATFAYTTLNGKPVVQTSEQVDYAKQYEHLLPVQISLKGTQWHVVSSYSLLSNSTPPQFLIPICDTAEHKVDNNTFLGRTFESSFAGMGWRFIAMPDAASCLIIVTMQQSLASVEAQPSALCLYRFGIFLAANSLAHTYWPHMQVATENEQHTAQQVYNASPST